MILYCIYIAYATKDAKQGAQTQIFLAASSEVSLQDSGKYFDNMKESMISNDANNEDLSNWLFEESEKLTKCKFPVVTNN